MTLCKKILVFISRYFILIFILEALLVSYLNYYGHIMLNLFPYYIDFKHIILSGFNPKAGIIGTPTFPMWGYGWLLIITESKIALIAIQNTLAITSLYVIIKFIEKSKVFQHSRSNILFKVLIYTISTLFCFSLY